MTNESLPDAGSKMPPPLPAPPRVVARWRWGVHLAMLTALPTCIGVWGLWHRQTGQAAFPKTSIGLLWVCFWGIVQFGLVFCLAWIFSRARADQLLLRWRGKLAPIGWGFLYSIALRLGLGVLGAFVLYVLMVMGVISRESFDPSHNITAAVDVNVLASDPIYLTLMLTVASFILGGLREELWRAGMLAAVSALLPALMQRRANQIVAMSFIAVVFGFGHFYMGWFGFFAATFLGLGLGVIMVVRQSIWEAAIAHGFLDATTFALLPLVAHLRQVSEAVKPQ